MGGCPYAGTRPSVGPRLKLNVAMKDQRSVTKTSTQPLWWCAVGLGITLSCGQLQAKEWTGSIGEPLRDSTQEALTVVKHLKNIGARFYGSWKCPACFQQMSLFGKQAGAEVNYIECDRPKQQPKEHRLCQESKITAVPTWILPNGERRVGLQQLDQLAEWMSKNGK